MSNYEDSIHVTNPQERGFLLPIGVIDGVNLRRDFALRELGYPIEKAVGQFKKRNPTLPSTMIITKVISLTLSKLAGEEWKYSPDDDLETEMEATIKVGQMFLADVYYIYVMLRIQELSEKYKFGNYACSSPQCGHTGEIIFDLNQMDVTTVKDLKVLRRKVPLLHGIKFRDGSVKKAVYIQPMLWVNMTTNELAEAAGDPSLMKLHFIRYCVVGVEGFDGDITLTDEEMASLRKYDIEKLAAEINAINIGPAFIVQGTCPGKNCDEEFLFPVDWEYENFFAISSQ
jgi:hypothetical protein